MGRGVLRPGGGAKQWGLGEHVVQAAAGGAVFASVDQGHELPAGSSSPANESYSGSRFRVLGLEVGFGGFHLVLHPAFRGPDRAVSKFRTSTE